MQASLNRWQPWIFSILIALMPLSFTIDLHIKIWPTVLLVLAGVTLLIRHASTRRSYLAAWPALAAAVLLMAYVLFSVLGYRLGWRPLDRPAHVLLFLLIAAVFTQPLRMRLIWGGFSLTTIALGAVCIAQRHLWGIERPYGLNGGASASIELATVLLGLSLVALARLLASRSRPWERALHLVAMAVGMYGALLTQSRGPLLAFVPMFLLLVWLHARRTGRWRLSLGLTALVCVAGATAMFATRGNMIARFEAIAAQVSTFDPQNRAHGSVRERMEMWRTASRAFVTHPLTGIGLDRFESYAQREIAAGRSNPVIGRYNQPHNQYLEAAATGGVPGLLVLLLVFVLPLRYFIVHARHADDAVALPAQIGIALIGLYMLCALSDGVFYRIMSQSLYYFLVLGLALRIGRLTSQPSPAAATMPATSGQGR